MNPRKKMSNKKVGLLLSLLIAILLTLLAILQSGCNGPPAGVKAALFTAEATLGVTAEQARAQQIAPWATPASEAPAEQLERLQLQVTILIETLEQCRGNLAAVIGWAEAGRTTPLPTTPKGGDGQ